MSKSPQVGSDRLFFITAATLSGLYVLLIVGLVLADFLFTSPAHLWEAIQSPEILYSIQLTVVSCTLATVMSLLVAIPLGYLMSRYEFRGKNFLDVIVDIPIVLPPLVVGLSLLILCQVIGGVARELPYTIASVVIAQFSVACAFAVRTMRVTFDQINPRSEQVALTLGCSRAQAFFKVVLPEASRGVFTAATLAWARSLGEFGPILIFAGATRMKTEVLSTTVFLELSVGHLEGALAVSLLMVMVAVGVLLMMRYFGMRISSRRGVKA